MPSRFAQTLDNNTSSKEEKAASRMASQTDVMLYSVDEKPLTLHLKKFENIYFLSESKTYIALI